MLGESLQEMFPLGFCVCGRFMLPAGGSEPVCDGCGAPKHLCLTDQSRGDCWKLSTQERAESVEAVVNALRRMA